MKQIDENEMRDKAFNEGWEAGREYEKKINREREEQLNDMRRGK